MIDDRPHEWDGSTPGDFEMERFGFYVFFYVKREGARDVTKNVYFQGDFAAGDVDYREIAVVGGYAPKFHVGHSHRGVG